ncbi:FAD binding domain-containing protein [Lindgomyces ingoldianus]|uniref:FAD binding domain-containing protein n=1 Tax=Lindgomyces ingoldianus TaxID=673940 RepID=A0ACB6QXH8_9PLEO|nr:FAD binding domain-containing protein [Lindgomyces ingoldianus]KAF2470782.1 FAD binding domain-containing protein [Lindgomyces ingoldianus]
MSTLSTLAALLLVVQTAFTAPTETSVSSVFGSEKVACSIFKQKYPDHTFYPNTAGYTYETQSQYWSARQFSLPACVFVPSSATQVSFAITTLTLTLSKFAIRGGGHMPVPGYNNIDSNGILLSTSNLSTLALSKDQATVSIGPGNRWRNVYAYLQPYGLAVAGGRVGSVGVPGLLLGGGISFYSNQYGFASNNVVKYECVLASGIIIEATARNAYSDLFWALKGGGNSFCIVTRFDLKAFKSPKVWVGMAQYDQSQSANYLDAVYTFGKYGALDSKAAIIPTVVMLPGINTTIYVTAKFYDSETSSPTVFENFTAPNLVSFSDSFALQPLSTYIDSTDVLQPLGLRQEFRVMSSIVSRDAIGLIHDTYTSAVSAKLSGVANLTTTITFQPITKEFIQQGINAGGNPQGVDISKAPYFWMDESWSWTREEDDETILNFADSVTADINKQLQAKGLAGTYLYMNDAGKGQPIFQSYPAKNLERLKEVREKYDPSRIYTNLTPGGWKVLQA